MSLLALCKRMRPRVKLPSSLWLNWLNCMERFGANLFQNLFSSLQRSWRIEILRTPQDNHPWKSSTLYQKTWLQLWESTWLSWTHNCSQLLLLWWLRPQMQMTLKPGTLRKIPSFKQKQILHRLLLIVSKDSQYFWERKPLYNALRLSSKQQLRAQTGKSNAWDSSF